MRYQVKTESLCATCLRVVPAFKCQKGHEVFIEKTCPEHGLVVTKIAKDAKRFFDKTFDVKGKEFTPICQFNGECGKDCGWCDSHLQHICTGLIEVTGRCNLSCPTCYFGEKSDNDISITEFKNRLGALLTVESGHLDVLQISGGECLMHPDFCQLLDEALQASIGRILVNTNGLELLKNEAVFNKIKEHRDRVEVYLQFDGFDDSVYRILRGCNLLEVKKKILQKLNDHEIKICLAVTVYQGNLQEIPAILRLSTEMKHISGVTLQRLTKVGSACATTVASVFQEDILLAIASSGFMKYEHMIPLPCSHENCTSLGFLLCQNDKVYSLGDYVDFTKCKDAISNRIAFDKTILDYMQKNVCKCFVGKMLGSSFMLEKLQDFANGNGSSHKDMKVVRVVVKNFMDADTFDFERARKCCTGVSMTDGRIVPFCIYNAIKGRNVW